MKGEYEYERCKAMILGERGSCLGRAVTFLFPVIYCAYK